MLNVTGKTSAKVGVFFMRTRRHSIPGSWVGQLNLHNDLEDALDAAPGLGEIKLHPCAVRLRES